MNNLYMECVGKVYYQLTHALHAEIEHVNEANFDSWFQTTIDTAALILTSTNELRPTLVMLMPGSCPEKSVQVVMDISPFLGNAQTKEAFATVMPRVIKMLGVYARVQITEAWCVNASSKEELMEMQPSTHPKRVEALHAIVETTNSGFLWAAEMKRDDEGYVSLEKPVILREDKDTWLSGQMARWIRPEEEVH